MVSTLIVVVFVVEPLDVSDASVQVPQAASVLLPGESGTVSTNQTLSRRLLSARFIQKCLFLPKDSSDFYLYEERTEGRERALCISSIHSKPAQTFILIILIL